jgi:AcrR family transcriptional regulator
MPAVPPPVPNAPLPVRRRILDAAFTAFMHSGYEGASTAEIARLAKVSKRDLYAHFPGKQAMLAACVTERAHRMRRPLLLPAPQDPSSLRETLVQYGMAVVRELSQPEVLATYRLAVLNAETAPDVALTLDQLGRADATGALTALLLTACRQGLLHGAEPEEMALIFNAILMRGGIQIRMLMRVANAPAEKDIRQRAEVAATCLWRLFGVMGPFDVDI